MALQVIYGQDNLSNDRLLFLMEANCKFAMIRLFEGRIFLKNHRNCPASIFDSIVEIFGRYCFLTRN